jgi:hypothetical protein
MSAEPKELQLLTVSVETVLMAFNLARDFSGSTGKPQEDINTRWGFALAILDRAVQESDLGQELWETRINKGTGDITIGKPK